MRAENHRFVEFEANFSSNNKPLSFDKFLQELAVFVMGGVSVGAVGAIAPTVFEESPIVTSDSTRSSEGE